MPAALPPDPNDTAVAARSATQLLERLRVATRGEYDVFGELGRGGMATVYLAHEISLDRKVAIKVMAPGMVSGPGLVERFKREARTAASLAHPNIIPIYAVREVDELLFCVIKLVQGTPLDGIMKELGQLPIPMVQAILAQVGDALGYAHRHGVVHRDIKPGNILIDDEGWAVVTDFGIAKVLEETEGLTMTGMAVGTPTYMSPEQASGDAVTGASDQYSLGVVAYEMLAGRPPFTGTSMMALMYSHFHDEVPPLETFRPDCPPELRDAVMRMLRKAPADRFLTMEEATMAMGARPLSRDDPTRSQLMALARTGTTHRIVSQVQTPRSPIPLTRKRANETPAPMRQVKRHPVLVGAGAIGLLAAGYLLARLPASGVASAPVAQTVDTATLAGGTPATAAAAGSVVAPVGETRQAAVVPAPATPRPQPAGSRETATTPRGTAAQPPAKEPVASLPPQTVDSPVIVARTPARDTTAPAARVGAPPVTQPQGQAEPPAAPPRTPPAATTPADPTVEVRALIQSFASALASSDMAAARNLYPGMTTQQREGFEALWKDGGTMTPRWTISDIAVDGNTATARISGSNLVTARRGTPQEVPVALNARLERRGTEWRLISLVN